jgi:LPXTG-site transpeptidase (sortase) family protein
MSLDIPRLKIKSGVVQTTWEPPPFTIGQIRGTSNISLGNSVLIGHLSGAAGNVFAHLEDLKPGDPVTAVSRGLPYKFVVSRVFKSSNTDRAPMGTSDDARLTLMTCAGIWNPFTHDYSERLWVVAEPPEQAEISIANAAATATAEATAGEGATATALAEAPTATPMPTPYAGEPSLPGGLGNTRADVGKAFGAPLGETPARLVVFRPKNRGEIHVHFTPDPPRTAFVAEIAPSGGRLTFEAAVAASRQYFPLDTQPRMDAPEGNPAFVVERFSSATLAMALGTGDFSVVYVRDRQGLVTRTILGLGDDIAALIDQSAQ